MSAETVYGGGPTAPPLGHSGTGTLPVTGFEVAVLVVVALALLGLGAILFKIGGGSR